MKRIIVDLTPVLPGGENGGAKVMTLELIRHLGRLALDWEFVLLTSAQTHDELSVLDAANVRRFCAAPQPAAGSAAPFTRRGIPVRLREGLKAILPPPLRFRLRTAMSRFCGHTWSSSLPRQLGGDLLFCPFTAPFFYDPTVPVISVIYDLQYRYYPQFFTADEVAHRDRHFKEACRTARELVCISEYVRQTVLENADVSPEHVTTAHIRLPFRISQAPPEVADPLLERLQLHAERFLFFPANFWPHKNHEMLLTAFGMFRARNPQTDLKLVCTGAPGARMQFLQDAVQQMGLAQGVVFPGYLSDSEFSALMGACEAVIFPSLYEGFGMPVLEAMAFGKPVLCSDVTSLPEVAGDAAVLFDPKRPQSVLQAIERIETEPDLAADLRKRGALHLEAFGDAEQMAREYLAVFQKAATRQRGTWDLSGRLVR